MGENRDIEREYVPRRSTAPRRQTVSRTTSGRSGGYAPRRSGGRRRKSGPPPILFLGIGLIVVIILVIVLVVALTRGGSEKDPGTSGSSTASVSSGVESGSSLASTSSGVSQPEVSSEVTPTATVPPEKNVEGLATEVVGTVLKVGDAGYEFYNFVESAANNYSSTIADAATQLSGTADVYDIVVPTGIDIVLPEEVLAEYNTSDQKKAIDYIYASVKAQNDTVKTVDAFGALKLHNNDYVYFRTDHHWTQLGAYYAYQAFCDVREGFTAPALEKFTKKSYEGYLGTFYAQDSSLGANPDTVEAYLPPVNTTMTITQSDGTVLEDYPMIMDGTDYDPDSKYLIFIGGDQPFEEIHNKDMAEGPSCVVVKESFGNAFVPFLLNNYKTVYVVDYRYYSGNIPDLVREKGAEDLIFVNNISMTRNEELVASMGNNFK